MVYKDPFDNPFNNPFLIDFNHSVFNELKVKNFEFHSFDEDKILKKYSCRVSRIKEKIDRYVSGMKKSIIDFRADLKEVEEQYINMYSKDPFFYKKFFIGSDTIYPYERYSCIVEKRLDALNDKISDYHKYNARIDDFKVIIEVKELVMPSPNYCERSFLTYEKTKGRFSFKTPRVLGLHEYFKNPFSMIIEDEDIILKDCFFTIYDSPPRFGESKDSKDDYVYVDTVFLNAKINGMWLYPGGVEL